MRLKIVAAALLLVVGVGAIGYVVFVAPTAGASSAQQYLTATAARTNVVQQAVATGNVAPAALYGLAFGRSAEIIESAGSGSASTGSWTVADLKAAVGQAVKKGDVLATADESDAKAAMESAKAALQSAQQTLSDDQAKPTGDDRASAQNALDQAKQSLTDKQQSQADTKAQNALSVSDARDAWRKAQKQLTDDTNAGFGSTTLKADRDAVTSAHQQYLSTVAQVTASNHQADQSVSSAQLSLAAAQQAYNTAIEPADAATIASDQAAVTQAQQTLDTANSTLGAATITAPDDGVITAVNVAVGADAPSGDAIELQSSDLQVTADVTETDLPSIAVGQPASISIAAANTTVDGTVEQIAPTSDSSSSSVVTYPVTISLPDVPAAVKAGMSANVSITTASASNVVAVPAIALLGTTGNYSVRTITDGQEVQTVPVEVGLVTSTLAEITSGIDAGTAVVVGTSTTRSGTSTTTGGFGGGGFGGGFPGGGTFVRGVGR
jgi:RND family efflux transporter MFP subunit